jgi:hypothetical protein
MKVAVLQAHLTPLYCCGYENHTLELQVQSQLPLKILVDGISGYISMLNDSSNSKIFNPTLGSQQTTRNEKPCKQQQFFLESG